MNSEANQQDGWEDITLERYVELRGGHCTLFLGSTYQRRGNELRILVPRFSDGTREEMIRERIAPRPSLIDCGIVCAVNGHINFNVPLDAATYQGEGTEFYRLTVERMKRNEDGTFVPAEAP